MMPQRGETRAQTAALCHVLTQQRVDRPTPHAGQAQKGKGRCAEERMTQRKGARQQEATGLLV